MTPSAGNGRPEAPVTAWRPAAPAGTGVERIDWQRPWLAPYRALGEPLAQAVARGCAVHQALNDALARRPVPLAAGALRFVPQHDLPAGEAYESFIHRRASVPTRDDLHDFFNGLVWLHWPGLKRRLNELQAGAIRQAQPAGTRGRLRDALTLFDESGAWIDAGAGHIALLRAHRWRELFVHRRHEWQAAVRVTLVGHALLEKLCAPYLAATAHGWPGLPPQPLQAADFVPRPFLPLPVLGVPGWWLPNEDPGFYGDERVFRPLRHPPAALEPGPNAPTIGAVTHFACNAP